MLIGAPTGCHTFCRQSSTNGCTVVLVSATDRQADETIFVEVAGEVVRRPSENPYTRWERNFIHQMKRLREAKGMTQTDLARGVHVLSYGELKFHQQTIQRIENGERPVRLNEAHVIAQVLDAELDTMTASGRAAALELRFAVDRMRRGAGSMASLILNGFTEWLDELEELATALSHRLPDREDATTDDLDPVAEWGMAWVSAILKVDTTLREAWTLLRELSGEGPRLENSERGWRNSFFDAPVIEALEEWRRDYLSIPTSRADDVEQEAQRADLTELYDLFPDDAGQDDSTGVDADFRIVPGMAVRHEEFGTGVVADLGVPGADYGYEGVWVIFDNEPHANVGMETFGKRFVPVDKLTVLADDTSDTVLDHYDNDGQPLSPGDLVRIGVGEARIIRLLDHGDVEIQSESSGRISRVRAVALKKITAPEHFDF